MKNIWEVMRFFADYPQARIAEEDQQNARLRDAGHYETKFRIDEMGMGHVYAPLISSPIVKK